MTRYVYDGDSINVLYETDASGNVLRQYVYGVDGVRVAMKSKGQTVYYHYNPHGDVIVMTDQDGKTVATYEYDAWGNVLKSEATGIAAENPFGYAGYMYNKETSMYYLMARYYHPMHGVFISVDPDPGDEDDPITQNGYTYGDNNPVMHVDPDGHWVWLAINAGFAAYDGYKAYKKHGWKATAVAVGVGLVGGTAFKAAKLGYKTYKFAKNYKKMFLVARYSFQKYQVNGWKKLSGYSKVKNYKNRSKPYLPRIRKNYKEYDAAGYIRGARGSERFVVHHGKFGKKRIYYTPNHYRSWMRIK
ncbi:RHS repeat-associated core domain-containing protein [Microbacteriaceae bacterium 4G12]